MSLKPGSVYPNPVLMSVDAGATVVSELSTCFVNSMAPLHGPFTTSTGTTAAYKEMVDGALKISDNHNGMRNLLIFHKPGGTGFTDYPIQHDFKIDKGDPMTNSLISWQSTVNAADHIGIIKYDIDRETFGYGKSWTTEFASGTSSDLPVDIGGGNFHTITFTKQNLQAETDTGLK